MHRIRNPAYRFTCTEGSNPSLSASYLIKTPLTGRFCFLHTIKHINKCLPVFDALLLVEAILCIG